MSYAVVTCFSGKGYKEYGSKFISSFVAHWPEEIKLYAYYNDMQDKPVFSEYVDYIDLETVPEYIQFKTQHENNPIAKGRKFISGMRWKSKEIEAGYSFRFDAFKFFHKVASIYDAARKLGSGKLLWIDADVFTFKDIPPDFINKVMPDDTELCFLGRANTHSECGFVGYNLDSSNIKNLIICFFNEYLTGSVFDLPEWHDSYVFDYVKDKFDLKENNLSNAIKGHVWVSSILADYMDHMKGDRKVKGFSPEMVKKGKRRK